MSEATIWVSLINGTYNISAQTRGDTAGEAKGLAELILECFARDRQTAIRVAPEVSSEKDYNTKEWSHKGIVRFAFCDQPGERQLMEKPFMPGLAPMVHE